MFPSYRRNTHHTDIVLSDWGLYPDPDDPATEAARLEHAIPEGTVRAVIRHIDVFDADAQTPGVARARVESASPVDMWALSSGVADEVQFAGVRRNRDRDRDRNRDRGPARAAHAEALIVADSVPCGTPIVIRVPRIHLYVTLVFACTDDQRACTFYADLHLPYEHRPLVWAAGMYAGVGDACVVARYPVNSARDRARGERQFDAHQTRNRESCVKQVLLQLGAEPITGWAPPGPVGIAGVGTAIDVPVGKWTDATRVFGKYGREIVVRGGLSDITVVPTEPVAGEPTAVPQHHISIDCEMISAMTEEEACENLVRYGTRTPFPTPARESNRPISTSLCHWREDAAGTITNIELIILALGHGGEPVRDREVPLPEECHAARLKTLDRVSMCELPRTAAVVMYPSAADLIEELFFELSRAPIIAIHGHNINRFDLPYLTRYFLAHQMRWKRAPVDYMLSWGPILGQPIGHKSIEREPPSVESLLVDDIISYFPYAWTAGPLMVVDVIDCEGFISPKHTCDGLRLDRLAGNAIGRVWTKMEGFGGGASVTPAWLRGEDDRIHAYCAVDTILSMMLPVYLRLVPMGRMLARLCDLTPGRVMTLPGKSKGALMQGLYPAVAHEQGVVVAREHPDYAPYSEMGYPGGFVFAPPFSGPQTNVSTLDFASLYPSIIIALNLCYTTLLAYGHARMSDADAERKFGPANTWTRHVVGMLDNGEGAGAGADAGAPAQKRAKTGNADPDTAAPGMTVAALASGAVAVTVHVIIRADTGGGKGAGILPRVCRLMLEKRKVFKRLKRQYLAAGQAARALVADTQQLACKVVANSMYGLIGSASRTHACKIIAAMTTQRGRDSIQSVCAYLEKRYAPGPDGGGLKIWTDCRDLLRDRDRVPDRDVPKYVFSAVDDLDALNTPDAGDVPDVPDVPDVFDSPDSPDAPDAREAAARTIDAMLARAPAAELQRMSEGPGFVLCAGDTDSVMMHHGAAGCVRIASGPRAHTAETDILQMAVGGWTACLMVNDIPLLRHPAMVLEHESSGIFFYTRKGVKKRYLCVYVEPGAHDRRIYKIQGFEAKKRDSRHISSRLMGRLQRTIMDFDPRCDSRAALIDTLVDALQVHIARVIVASGAALDIVTGDIVDAADEPGLYAMPEAWARMFRINPGKSNIAAFSHPECPVTMAQMQDPAYRAPEIPSAEGPIVAMKRWLTTGIPVELGLTEVHSLPVSQITLPDGEVLRFDVMQPHISRSSGLLTVRALGNAGLRPRFWDIGHVRGAAEAPGGVRLDFVKLLMGDCRKIVDFLTPAISRGNDDSGAMRVIQGMFSYGCRRVRAQLLSDTPVPCAYDRTYAQVVRHATGLRAASARGGVQSRLTAFFRAV